MNLILPALALAATVWLLLDVAFLYPAQVEFDGMRVVRIDSGTQLTLANGFKITVSSACNFAVGDYVRFDKGRIKFWWLKGLRLIKGAVA